MKKKQFTSHVHLNQAEHDLLSEEAKSRGLALAVFIRSYMVTAFRPRSAVNPVPKPENEK